MFKNIRRRIKGFDTSRTWLIICVFVLLFSVLVVQIFKLQLVEADIKNVSASDYKKTKYRDIKSTRGNIYDVNGNLLAYNVLGYSLVMEDSALLNTNAKKNEMIYKLIKLIESYGYELEVEFGIELDETDELVKYYYSQLEDDELFESCSELNNCILDSTEAKLEMELDAFENTNRYFQAKEYVESGKPLIFNVSGSAEQRFKKNAYGRTSVSNLTEEEADATASEVYSFMRYGNNKAAMFSISDSYTLKDALKIMAIRYTIFSTQTGTQFTLVSDIDEKLVVAIKENSDSFPGVEILEKTSRVYNDSLYFAHIVGYTGTANATEIENKNSEVSTQNDTTVSDTVAEINNYSLLYNSTDVIGKTGIEKSMEDHLSGTKGVQLITTNTSGRFLSTEVTLEPVAGQDIYLTIDRETQIACYHILERNLAAILISKLTPKMDYGTKGKKASDIKIPIYEAYYAFFDNQLIDVNHFEAADATPLEKEVFSYYQDRKNTIVVYLKNILSYDNDVLKSKIPENILDYYEELYYLIKGELLNTSAIDTSDSVYLEFINDEISINEYLKYAITQNWVNLSKLGVTNEYYSTSEIYDMLYTYAFDALAKDIVFKNLIYRDLIFDYTLSGRKVCMLLYDQEVLEYEPAMYSKLKNSKISAYDFIIEKITDLEITPGQLGLEPCSGSIVVTDVNSGNVIAMVTYPSYDNNMLANKIDWDYYQTLLNSNSLPLINRPAMQTTTSGSTFKPLVGLAGLAEGVIKTSTKIKDYVTFSSAGEAVTVGGKFPKCWSSGGHGTINLSNAIKHSCNYFFYEVGYRMSLNSKGEYSSLIGIQKIQQYAKMFGLSEKTGIEISEATPAISGTDSIRTSIGYYHSFTPVSISRYITAVANRGTVFNLTLLDKIKDSSGAVVLDNEASVHNNIDMFSNEQWNAVLEGMYNVVNTNVNSLDTLYKNLSIDVAGKTGTAQVNSSTPNHALFVSFAPYISPEISVTVVIPNGYQSANAAYIAREVYGFYFDGENKEALLSGNVKAGTATSIVITD